MVLAITTMATAWISLLLLTMFKMVLTKNMKKNGKIRLVFIVLLMVLAFP